MVVKAFIITDRKKYSGKARLCLEILLTHAYRDETSPLPDDEHFLSLGSYDTLWYP
jgi:hypothetical protein